MKLKIIFSTIMLSLTVVLCVYFHVPTDCDDKTNVKNRAELKLDNTVDAQQDNAVDTMTIRISIAGDCTLGFDERRGYYNKSC